MNIVRIRINNQQYLILTLNEEIYSNDLITPWSMILWNFATIEFALVLLFCKVKNKALTMIFFLFILIFVDTLYN